ncbi:putative Tricarboxylate transport protein [Leucosporidium creatinivorum]|uniref:Putative Tricarboxylate transport protein n=1 Tax=Leucosporidium creatinivorum TaxID=106004 RepID=A0A1Y2FD10_9BASI|nr:putative Tricarboxylate transport protein [Leucosporidium creatinivorum]
MNSQTPAYFSLLAGASAGAVESFATFPTEFVKTSAQLQTAGGRATTPVAIFKDTWKTKGIAGFYAGCAPVVAGNALKAGVRFLTYDTVRDSLRDSNGKITPARTVLAGICAGACESIVAVTPSESIKTRLIENRRAAVGSAVPAGTLETIGALVRDEGVLSLWRGLAPTMMKQCANSAVRFSAYQGLKDLVLGARSTTELDSLSTMAIGSTAGIITVYATQPFDTIKTRQQSRTAYKSSLQAFSKILTQEGPATFWRGSSPRVLRLLISGSVSFLVYEEAMKLLKAI